MKSEWRLPPWLAFPEIERYSIGWRMGSGEAYLDAFLTWFDGLPAKKQAEYQALFPEPITWNGWWADEDPEDNTGSLLENNDLSIDLWRPNGQPRYTLEEIRQRAASGENLTFVLFWQCNPSENGSLTAGCFSQWWMSDFTFQDRRYCCMEQMMMASKAALFGDKETFEKIMQCPNPRTIKSLGRKVHPFDQKWWNRAKYPIVINGNYCKFSQDRSLRDFLLATGDSILVEASPYDGIWGIHLSEKSPNARNPAKWHGQNLLGFALMEVRDELRRVSQNEGLCGPGASKSFQNPA